MGSRKQEVPSTLKSSNSTTLGKRPPRPSRLGPTTVEARIPARTRCPSEAEGNTWRGFRKKQPARIQVLSFGQLCAQLKMVNTTIRFRTFYAVFNAHRRKKYCSQSLTQRTIKPLFLVISPLRSLPGSQ